MNTPLHPDPRSDAELVDALNRGESPAFDTIYFRYRDWVAALAHRFTGNAEDALDVLQETFSYFFRKFPGFRLSAAMTTFLYPVIKNLSIAARRKRSRFAGGDESLNWLPAPSEHESQSSRHELATVLAAVPEPQREVLLMRFVDDFTLDEIAQALSIPLGTVKSRLHNALATLRKDERTQRYFEQ